MEMSHGVKFFKFSVEKVLKGRKIVIKNCGNPVSQSCPNFFV